MATSFLNQNNLSRGIRNNNPGNLIYTSIPWDGKIPYSENTDWSGNPANVLKHFEQFQDINHGIRAAADSIVNGVSQNGYSLTQLMNHYAPASENDTAAYIQNIVNVTGLNPDEPITWNFLLLSEVLRAIIQVENGGDGSLVSDQDIVDSINLLPQVILDELGAAMQQVEQTIQDNPKTVGTGLVVVGLAAFTWVGYKIYKAA